MSSVPPTGVNARERRPCRIARRASGIAGQDLVEYALLLAFIALTGAALYVGIAGGTVSAWTHMNTNLTGSYVSSAS